MLAKSKLKYIQTLSQKKFRDSERLFIAEGPKLVAELLADPAIAVREVYALEDWIIANEKQGSKAFLETVTEQELERISQLTTPNKVIALVEYFDPVSPVITKGKITLALDDLQDPGNMGTILRIADWYGIEQLVCSRETADIYNPKVVQSSMGSIGRVRVFYTELREWLEEQKDIQIYASVLDGEDITKMEKQKEGIILIGNESRGIHPELIKRANAKITIPKKGKAESLNAAVATGIILSHFF